MNLVIPIILLLFILFCNTNFLEGLESSETSSESPVTKLLSDDSTTPTELIKEAPTEISSHTHNKFNPEREETLQAIRKTIAKIKEKVNTKDDKSYLTPEQYNVWKRVVNALKSPKPIGKTPQPINVNVDVKDSRELHYEVPGGGPGAIPSIVKKMNMGNDMNNLLKKMKISPAAREEMEEAFKKYKPSELGGLQKPGKAAKFQQLEKSSFLAYNEDDYGDVDLDKMKKQKKEQKHKDMYSLNGG